MGIVNNGLISGIRDVNTQEIWILGAELNWVLSCWFGHSLAKCGVCACHPSVVSQMHVAWWDAELYSFTHSLRTWAGDAYRHYITAVSALSSHQSAVHPGTHVPCMACQCSMYADTDNRLNGECTVKLAIISCEYTFDWIISPLHINQLQW